MPDKKKSRVGSPALDAIMFPKVATPALNALYYGVPEAEVKAYEPGPRELMAQKLQQQLERFMPAESAKKGARKITGYTYPAGLIDVTPVGLGLAGGEGIGKGIEAAGAGEYGRAALEGLMGAANVIPGEMIAAGAAKTLGPLAAKTLSGLGALGATAWHGSPHRFEKFDLSKIGTGEGAQAYGHGLYFAEAPGVARGYADQVKNMGAINDINQELSRLAKIMSADEIGYRNYRTEAGKQAAAQYDALMAQKEAIRTAPGQMYKVDIPDEAVARMLDWDKPLSEQHPDVQKIIGDEIKRIGGSAHTGEQAYKELMFEARMAGTKSNFPVMRDNIEALAASNRLRDLGIPGIKYLDEGSRAAGEGTRNFVLFSDELPRILEVNEKPTGALPWAPGEWKPTQE